MKKQTLALTRWKKLRRNQNLWTRTEIDLMILLIHFLLKRLELEKSETKFKIEMILNSCELTQFEAT